jgi:hypothetical protein
MGNLSSLLSAFLLIVLPLHAHEHWVSLSPGPYQSDQPLTVSIRSGHELGESEFLIDTDLIQEANVQAPSGIHIPLKMQAQGNEHIAAYTPTEEGEYEILIKFRKRDKGPFSHILMTRFQVGDAKTAASSGQDADLAIVLDRVERKLGVIHKGDPVNVPIQLLRTDSRGSSLLRDGEGLSSLENIGPGFYVAVAHFRRQTVSLSFNLEE